MKALALLPLALVACAPPPDVLSLRVHVSDENVPLVLDAAHEWEERTGVHLDPVLITPDGCDSQDCVFVDEVPPEDLTAGWTIASSSCGDGHSGVGCTLVTADTWQAHTRIANNLRGREPTTRTGETLVRIVALHELGHALGLGHVEKGPVPSCMVPGIAEMARHVEPEDVWNYQRIRGGLR